MRALLILTGALCLGACVGQQAGERLEPLPQELEIAAPAGTVVLTDSVDQILVGDRLMDAGEHELALRAYYRAAAENGLDAEAMTAIAGANLALGRIGQAETQFRRALDLDESFVPAWNNLGVALMERGEYGEARRVFERAFALDSGRSDSIRDNLRLAIARMENSVYDEINNQDGLGLIRRGGGVYELRLPR
jgi:tetratricopeptide (TPR) repeat protein